MLNSPSFQGGHDILPVPVTQQRWPPDSSLPNFGSHSDYHACCSEFTSRISPCSQIASWPEERCVPDEYYCNRPITEPSLSLSSHSILSSLSVSSPHLNALQVHRFSETSYFQAGNVQANPHFVHMISGVPVSQNESPPVLDLPPFASGLQTPHSGLMPNYAFEPGYAPSFGASFNAAPEQTSPYWRRSSAERFVTPEERELPSPRNAQFRKPDCTTASIEPPETSQAIIPFDPDNPDWKLSPEVYKWIFAVLYPKRRANKDQTAPSGQCWFCSSVSKHAGSLQQHVAVLHRQRLARRFHAGREYNVLLALGFVVAQMEAEPRNTSDKDDVTTNEFYQFKDLLARRPPSKDTLHSDTFPMLVGKLREFCLRDSWIGVSCPNCGTWATRRVALKEHATVCTGSKSAVELNPRALSVPDTALPGLPLLRLTDSGRAARPSRRRVRRARGRGVTSASDVQSATPRAP